MIGETGRPIMLKIHPSPQVLPQARTVAPSLPDGYEFCELGPQDKSEIFSTIADREWEGDHSKWDYLLQHGECFGLRQGEELVGTAGVNKFENKVATLAMILVKKEHEGRGLGSALTERCLELAGDAVPSLYASEDGKPMYEKKFGFVEVGGSKVHLGRPKLTSHSVGSASVREADDGDWDEMVELDRVANGVDREKLLQHLRKDATKTMVSYEGDEITGFALEFDGYDSSVVGPLIAKEPAVAKELLQELFRDRQEEKPVTVQLNESFSELSRWLEENGMPAVARAPLMTLHGRALPGRSDWEVAVPGYPWG